MISLQQSGRRTPRVGVATREFVAVGLAIALLGAFTIILPYGHAYDEGIILSAGTFIRLGLTPYRDFWLLYGPGTAYMAAAAISVFGPDLLLFRVVGAAVAVLQGFACLGLAATFSNKLVAFVIAISAVVVPLVLAGPGFSAWSAAMACGLYSFLLSARSSRRPARFISGLLIGVAFVCRLDLGAYALIASLLTWRDWRIVAGFAAPVAPVALLLVLTVPWPELTSQLVWYPLIGTRQFRSLPLPMPWDAASIGGIYQVLAFHYLPIAAIAIASIWLVRHRSPVVLCVTLFAGFCQLQALGRADDFHAAQAFTPACLLLGLWLPRTWPPKPWRLLLFLGMIPATLMPLLAGGVALRDGRPPFDNELDLAVAYVRNHTSPTEAIFVGLFSNRYTFSNPILAYFLADRRPGVKDVMYAPGITNTDATQAEMTNELERSGTNYVILSITMSQTFEESNDSRIPGSTILDAYFRTHFKSVYTGAEVVVLRRDPGS